VFIAWAVILAVVIRQQLSCEFSQFANFHFRFIEISRKFSSPLPIIEVKGGTEMLVNKLMFLRPYTPVDRNKLMLMLYPILEKRYNCQNNGKGKDDKN
jgi:hypothetical protein